jgi:catalase
MNASLAQEILKAFDGLNHGPYPHFRPAHAKGLLLKGQFTPATGASDLTRAPHAIAKSTPVTVRFSNSTGVPVIPDNDPNAVPRGIGIRFHLGGDKHTDIIGHSTDGFPTRTPEEFIEFLKAALASATSTAKPTPIEAFLGSHPSALEFVMKPKPMAVSFATENYFGVNAYKFTNGSGAGKYGRYRIRPAAGAKYLDDAAAKSQSPNYLFDEIQRRVASGPVSFHIAVQVAAKGDVVNDSTVHWPEDRSLADFGEIKLTEVVAASKEDEQKISYDAIPRVDGIEASDDPLLVARDVVYLASTQRRQQR